MAKKKSRKSGKGGYGVGAFIGSIIMIAVIIAFMRATGNVDVNSIFNSIKNSSSSMQETASKAKDRIMQATSCNVLKNPNCVAPAPGRTPDISTETPPSHGDIDSIFNGVSNPLGHGGDSSKNNNSGNNNASDNKPQTTPLENSLNMIKVADPDNSAVYKRSNYPHWIIISGKCDARETVLARAGFKTNPKNCRALAGFNYTSPYTGEIITNPRSIDIDHVIPLGYADKHGANSWSTARKQEFANDLTQLLAVDASSNRIKGDKGPGVWMPSNKKFTCEYSKIWIRTALKYNLSIAQMDKDALKDGIKSCYAK